MNIINIDVDEQEAKVVYTFIPFILDILEKIEKNADAHFSVSQFLIQQDFNIAKDYKIWQVDDFDYENISHFAHTIPIYLRKNRPELIDDGSITTSDKLGFYCHPNHKKSPYIELFLKDIERNAGVGIKKFMWLLTKVLLHELSHAVIDIYNIRGFNGEDKMPYTYKFGKWREESMANAITLYIINKYGPRNLYNYSYKFMRRQPKEYMLGTKIKDVEYWGLRSIYINKLYGAEENLKKKWLDYVNDTPTAPGMRKWNKIFSEGTSK